MATRKAARRPAGKPHTAKTKGRQLRERATSHRKLPTQRPAVPRVASPEERAKGARTNALPSFHAACVVHDWQPELVDGDGVNFTPGVNEIAAELQKQAELVHGGELGRAESMLITQAHALQAIFAMLAQQAKRAQLTQGAQGLLGMALKAQAQCRATLQTLVEVKFPRQTQFVRQQNVAVNQQVNNGTAAPAMPRAHGEEDKSSTELIEGAGHEAVDCSAPGTPGATHPKLAAVAPINRA